MIDSVNEIQKPEKWPASSREATLELLNELLDQFMENPSYVTKEEITSLTSSYDLNQFNMRGVFRVTEYEVYLINRLYLNASLTGFYSIKLYLYAIIREVTRMNKMIGFMDFNKRNVLEYYDGLYPALYLFHKIYQQFNINKNRSFVDEIIKDSNAILSQYGESASKIIISLINFVNDIGYCNSFKNNRMFALSREEFKKLMVFLSNQLRRVGFNPRVRPHRGILMTIISNFILKSRNNYNEDYICKYLSRSTAEKTIENCQIWMQKIQFLNDKREAKVLPEIFKSKKWLKYKWVKNVDFSQGRKYYVSSFCKSIRNTEMQKMYGECVYGYKNDRIAELISPISIINFHGAIHPMLSQVVAFDVIYDQDEIKKEINYLCDIIDILDLTDTEKNSFFEEIMQYWLLSIKDKKWAYERERRYVLFLYDEYDYLEIDESDNKFLKEKTSLFLFPDFILSELENKNLIKIHNYDKRRALYINIEYMYCDNCLSCDFDNHYGNVLKCPICGSSKYYKINGR